MAYQSLYRRYRSGSFSELRGQEHVVKALRNAVREDRVGHAYLFSGPRGTGKTSTARILAKALNCENLSDDGEPCGECESCRSIESGTSFDLHELDAASNNGVEAVRDLISRAGIGSPGRRKVYILDEVHMLSAGASNALLKTLEEPPPQVVFVLATTDPHKVLPTIRSRTQHLEFGLLPADVLEEHVRWVVADAGLDVDEEGIAYAMRQGGGSARDTLSALDQVVAAGGVPTGSSSVDGVVEAICENDTAAAMVAVAEALSAGREPRPLAEDLLSRLRDVFLASVAGPLGHLTDTDRERATAQAGRLGRATITRALELVGEAIADMRHVGDARIPLEVALVRLTRPDADTSLAALADRVARLERAGVAPAASSSGSSPTPSQEPVATSPAPAPSAPPPAPKRPAPSAPKAPSASTAPTAPAAPATPQSSAPSSSDEAEDGTDEPVPTQPTEATAAPPSSSPTGDLPGVGEIEAAWGSTVLPALSGKARARFNAGSFTAVDSEAEFSLPNPIHRDRCEELRPEVEAALASHFGRPVPLRLVVAGGAASPAASPPQSSSPRPRRSSATTGTADDVPPPSDERDADPFDDVHDDHDDVGDIADLEDADVATSSVDRLTELFPGAEVVEE
jgi:DNA polymerase III subunit gamma/tau